MLFTNTTLEINKISSRDGKEYKQLELFNIYNSRYFAQVDRDMTDKILFVKDNVTHRFLDIEKTEKGFMFKNTKSNKLTIVLDMLDYKRFTRDSKIEVSKDSQIVFDKIHEFKLKNRLNTNWTVSLFDVEEDGFGILKLTGTSGRARYLIVKDRVAKIFTLTGAETFLKENGIKVNLNQTEWTTL